MSTSTPASTPTTGPLATLVFGERQEAKVVRMVDWDTIVIETEGSLHSVHYTGIDTPDTHHPGKGATYMSYEAGDAGLAWAGAVTMIVMQCDISAPSPRASPPADSAARLR